MRLFPALKFLLAACGASLASSPLQAQELNPNYFYLVSGELIGRTIALGDPSDWNKVVTGREGVSSSGKIKVAPTAFKGEQDAIQITWATRKKEVGSLALQGNQLDLSSLKDKAALVIDMRVDVKPDKNVSVSLDCGYPCRAELSLNRLIKTMPRGEWFSLPLPLNCFKSDNFDLSKIGSPFSIATEGKFTVSITNVRLEKLGDGETGCAE